uniref:Uncharacterized protein n=1 Tax=Cacopsylla melanoneura TaxID=428564 RepID=A0A8D8ZBN9_9HEMI
MSHVRPRYLPVSDWKGILSSVRHIRYPVSDWKGKLYRDRPRYLPVSVNYHVLDQCRIGKVSSKTPAPRSCCVWSIVVVGIIIMCVAAVCDVVVFFLMRVCV